MNHLEFRLLTWVLKQGPKYALRIPEAIPGHGYAIRSSNPGKVADKFIEDAVSSGVGLTKDDFRDREKFNIPAFRSFVTDVADPTGNGRSSYSYDHPGANFVTAWEEIYKECVFRVISAGGRISHGGITVEMSFSVNVASPVPTPAKSPTTGGGAPATPEPSSA
jgi:hypothetical protein